jgi:ribonuclease P protein component
MLICSSYGPAALRSLRRESNLGSQVRAAARVSGHELAATDEKNLPTSQSPAQTHAWLSRSDGDAWRAQCAQTTPRQGPQTACDRDTAQAARLTGYERPHPRFAFCAGDRLHRRAEFLRVQRIGVRFQTDHFVVYAARFPGSQMVRLGTTVSRRLGNAVVRNRIKRRIRECFRLSLRWKLPAGTALVIIGRARAGAFEMPIIMGELDSTVARLQLRLKQGHE